MARPGRVVELSGYLQIPVGDLLLPCNFCGKFLTFAELLEFDYKNLRLIWKDALVFGCCTVCAFATAIYELRTFHQETVTGYEIEGRAQAPLASVVVRCLFCLKQLDLLEKLDICARHQEFHRVRSHWKGLCRHCRTIE